MPPSGRPTSVFLFGGALGGVVTAIVATELPETVPATGVRGSPAARVASRHTFLRLLRSRPFLGYSLQVAFSIAFFYAFVRRHPSLWSASWAGRPASTACSSFSSLAPSCWATSSRPVSALGSG